MLLTKRPIRIIMSTRPAKWLYEHVCLALTWFRTPYPRHDPPPTPVPLGTDLRFDLPLASLQKKIRENFHTLRRPNFPPPNSIREFLKNNKKPNAYPLDPYTAIGWKSFFTPRKLNPETIKYDLPRSTEVVSQDLEGFYDRFSECPYCTELQPDNATRAYLRADGIKQFDPTRCWRCDAELEDQPDLCPELAIKTNGRPAPPYDQPRLHENAADGQRASFLLHEVISEDPMREIVNVGVKISDGKRTWQNSTQVTQVTMTSSKLDYLNEIREMQTQSIFNSIDVSRTEDLEEFLPRGVLYV